MLFKGLSTVVEGSANQSGPKSDAAQPAKLNSTPKSTRRNDSVPVSPQATSRYSGTTALSQVTDDANGLDPDFVIVSLDVLWDGATRVLGKTIARPESPAEEQLKIIQMLSRPNAASSKALSRTLQHLRSILEESFHSDNNSYINPRAVLQSLFEDGLGSVPLTSRPDDMLFKANLAVLAADTLLADKDSSKTSEKFQSLDLEFPKLFISTFQSPKSGSLTTEPGSSVLMGDTFALALEIRTQYAIMLLKNQQYQASFDPDDILAQLFLLQSDDSNLGSSESLQQANFRGWQIEGLRDNDELLPDCFQSTVIERIHEIRRYCPLISEDTADFDGLEKRFPWQDFALMAATWINRRCEEIDDRVIQLGGGSRIVEQISAHRAQTITTTNNTIDSNIRSQEERRSVNATTAPTSTNAPKDSRRLTGSRK